MPAASVVTARDGAVPPGRQRQLAALLGAHVVELDRDHDAAVWRSEAFCDAVVECLGVLGGQAAPVGQAEGRRPV